MDRAAAEPGPPAAPAAPADAPAAPAGAPAAEAGAPAGAGGTLWWLDRAPPSAEALAGLPLRLRAFRRAVRLTDADVACFLARTPVCAPFDAQQLEWWNTERMAIATATAEGAAAPLQWCVLWRDVGRWPAETELEELRAALADPERHLLCEHAAYAGFRLHLGPALARVYALVGPGLVDPFRALAGGLPHPLRALPQPSFERYSAEARVSPHYWDAWTLEHAAILFFASFLCKVVPDEPLLAHHWIRDLLARNGFLCVREEALEPGEPFGRISIVDPVTVALSMARHLDSDQSVVENLPISVFWSFWPDTV